MTTVTGSVDRIVFRNAETGFCVARFQLTEPHDRGLSTTIIGAMPSIRPGEMLRVTGEWQVHPVHGRNFKVDRFEEELPTTADGIERYLGSGVVRGIGPITAGRIVDAFGERTLQVLDETPELLRDVPGISEKRLAVITEAWREQAAIRDLSMFLQDHGISVGLAGRIYEKYGHEAPAIISEDPYRLAHEVHGIGFKTADAVARKLGMSKRSLSRYLAGLKFVLSRATEDGHVYLDRDSLLDRASEILEAPIDELEPAVLELVHRGDAVAEDDHIYLTPFHVAESGIARSIQRLHDTPSPLTLDPRWDASDAVRRAGDAQGLELAPEQILAAEQALRKKVSIITGGPGTGKTSTLRTVIAALEEADISYCLCAPTGRAAKRVAETTGRSASTIHRLLEFQPALGIFSYDAGRPLPYDVVVVDEVSMLDTLLAHHLLKAVASESHVLLVGDADQLPAVGPGNVLRDMLESGAVPTVKLTHLFRQARGSQIVVGAHAVNAGQVPKIGNGAEDDLFFVRAESEEAAVDAVLQFVAERVPRRFGFDPVEDIQVLSPMNRGPAGVFELNERLQELLNPGGRGVPEMRRGNRVFRVGDKVMQIRNNYDRDVYNGDMGRVVEIDETDAGLMVSFTTAGGSIDVPYETGDLDELVLAYAVSVHKAQGSEFPCVVMPLVTRHFMLLERHLLYTAMTRARQLCLLIGSPKALNVAAATDRGQRRNTGLRARLSGTPTSQPHLMELA